MLAATLAGSAGVLASAAARAQPLSGQAIRDGIGADIVGPQNVPMQRENPDLLVPPATDKGDLPNLKWSFADSHMRLEEGGWARQTTVNELPISTEIAGVNMRLKAGAIRELHWHKASEWSIMLKGTARVTMVDPQGRNYIADLGEGDLWFFPSGFPHSIQGLGPDGCEFLLVFDDGKFSENNTFLITDWLKHTPRSVLAKNFQTSPDAFDQVPKELYIFQSALPPPLPPGRRGGPARADAEAVHLRDERRRAAGLPRRKGADRRSAQLRGLDHGGRAGRGRAPAPCASCTGTRPRTSGSTTSPVRRG